MYALVYMYILNHLGIELYTVLENRVKEAMLAGNEWVSIKDLKIRRDTYDIWESKHIKQ